MSQEMTGSVEKSNPVADAVFSKHNDGKNPTPESDSNESYPLEHQTNGLKSLDPPTDSPISPTHHANGHTAPEQNGPALQNSLDEQQHPQKTFDTSSSTDHHTNGDSTSRFPTLAGKVALVTGSSRGIGAGVALELAARGASVVVNYVRGREGAEVIVRKIEALGGKALAVQADVSKVPEITSLFEKAKEHFGKIDYVVSNSGMESFDKIEDITEEQFDLVFGLNLRAQFFVGQHAFKYCEEGGRLVLMSSIAAGLIGVGDHSLYSGSKMAINGITKSFAKDFGRRGITVNAVAPGGVKSDMSAKVAWRYIPGATSEWSPDEIESAMSKATPLGRFAAPLDVARVVAFLVSEDGGWVNGMSFFCAQCKSIFAHKTLGQIITISGGAGQ